MAKTHPTAISSLIINLNLIAHHNNMKKTEENLSKIAKPVLTVCKSKAGFALESIAWFAI